MVRRRLGVLIDRVAGSGGLDPALLQQLDEFLREEALPAAEAYEKVLEAGWVAEGGPDISNCPRGCWKSDFTCPTDYPFDAVEVELAEAGYVGYRNEIDAQVLAALPCICGHPLEYVGRRAPGSYRAFGMCCSCGHWLEF